jgi:CRISPR system Cascade subunit CasC
MKIEIHILQNFAPSCLNRDDTNTPKSCVFGNTPRARVSSQCWKRAVREYFRAENSELVSVRTKRLVSILTERLSGKVDATAIRNFVIEAYSKMDGKKPDETAVLIFIGEAEIAAAEACLLEGVTAKESLPKLLAARQSADVALFGRMLAEKPRGNIDAACQVAHALSTHTVSMEDDFFTAVDDIVQQREEIGAGMMGVQGFNSACLYRYALLDREQLIHNLAGDKAAASDVIESFIRAFTLAVPGAKQNSHAAQCLPSFGLLVARENGAPISLANAFAEPVRGSDLIGSSIEALSAYHKRVGDVYGLYDDSSRAVFHDRPSPKELGALTAFAQGSFAAAVATVMDRVRT